MSLGGETHTIPPNHVVGREVVLLYHNRGERVGGAFLRSDPKEKMIGNPDAIYYRVVVYELRLPARRSCRFGRRLRRQTIEGAELHAVFCENARQRGVA